MNLNKFTYQSVIRLLVLIITISPAAGQTKIDSLKHVIENEYSIRQRSILYLELSLAYKLSDLDKSEETALKALTFAEQSEDQKTTGLVHAHLGDLAFLQDSLNKAQKEYNYAIPLLEQAGEFNRLIRVYLSLGNRFIEKGNYPDAMNYYLKGFGISEETADSSYLPNLFNNLGVVYLNINDHQKALEYYAQALPLFEKLKDTMNIAGATTNIGSIYIQLGEYDIARKYYQKGYQIFKQMNFAAGQAHALFKLGLLDIKQARYEDALTNLFQSLRLQEANPGNVPGSKSLFMAETNINIGIAYLMQGNYIEAEKKLLDGYNVAMEEGQVSLISLAGENLSMLYRQKKNFEKALDYYITFKIYSDSIYNEDNVRKLTQLEMQHQYEAEMKEAEINRLEQEEERRSLLLIYISTIIGLLLVLIIVALFLKLENKKKKEAELERERLSEKLEHTNKELTTYVMYLLKKNEFILTIIEKLKKARLDAKPENKKVMAELIAELKSNTDTVSWEEFEVRFQQVHTDFYTRLSKQYPDLSSNEIRLCAFFKLNMTSKEIAALTYQSLNSIKVARYRLRKKLKMEQDESLVSFLAQF